MIEAGWTVANAIKGEPNQKIMVNGWVRTKRDSSNVSFVELNDGSSFGNLQIVIDHKNFEDSILSKISTGACIGVKGKLVESPKPEQPVELQAVEITVWGEADAQSYPLSKKRHSLEYLREIAHLRTRSNTFGSVFRVRNALSQAIHSFFQERGFIYVHTPIITASDAEGAGAMFGVTTLDLQNVPRNEDKEIDYSNDFFGKPAFLTVSGQLEAEIFALTFKNVYTFGPTFRAENSNSSRHLAEFWMIEPEMAFCDLDGNRLLAEQFLKHCIQCVMEKCPDDLEFFNKWVDDSVISTLTHVLETPFEHVTYTDAMKLLESSPQAFEYKPSWGIDIQTEHERYLSETYFKKPVVVTDYPKDIKAFYMRMNEDGKTVRAMDVLVPRIGEIIGGSQREERYDVLLDRLKAQNLSEEAYWWYLELRKYGTAPHAGFGLGFERMMMFLTGMKNIRDVIPFPRYPQSAEF